MSRLVVSDQQVVLTSTCSRVRDKALAPLLTRASSLHLVRTGPACRRPLAGVDVFISTGGRPGFGASAPSSTRATPTLFSGASEGSPEPLKLI